MGGLVELGLWRYNQYRDKEEQRFLRAQGYEMRAVLLAELNATLHLASGLASYIPTKQGRLDATELQPWLRGLFAQGRYIRNIDWRRITGLLTSTRLKEMSPLWGFTTPTLPSSGRGFSTSSQTGRRNWMAP